MGREVQTRRADIETKQLAGSKGSTSGGSFRTTGEKQAFTTQISFDYFITDSFNAVYLLIQINFQNYAVKPMHLFELVVFSSCEHEG
jgi:hypothetical protein